MGHDEKSVLNHVLALNKKLDIPLDGGEILSTIMLSVRRKIAEKGTPI